MATEVPAMPNPVDCDNLHMQPLQSFQQGEASSSPSSTGNPMASLVVHNVQRNSRGAEPQLKSQPAVEEIPIKASAAMPEPEEELDVSRDQTCLICMDGFSASRGSYPLPCSNHSNSSVLVHYRCISAWLGGNSTCPLCRGPADLSTLKPKKSLSIVDPCCFALAPVAIDVGILRCLVKETKRGLLRQLIYEVYLQPTQGGLTPSPEDKLIMTARKQLRSPLGSEYIISVEDAATSSSSRVGRLASNFLGTQFTFFEEVAPRRIAPSDDSTISTKQPLSRGLETILSLPEITLSGSSEANNERGNHSFVRKEAGCVTYEANRTRLGRGK